MIYLNIFQNDCKHHYLNFLGKLLQWIQAATIKITSKDFKNHNFDYAILNKNVTLNNTLNSLYDDIKLFVIKAIDKICHYNLAMGVFELQFRKNGYSDPNLLEKETTLYKLYIFSSGGKKKHWVWLELINTKDSSLYLSTLPGFNLGFMV